MQVPADIPRPDYAETGQPFSEIESRQQSIGNTSQLSKFKEVDIVFSIAVMI